MSTSPTNHNHEIIVFRKVYVLFHDCFLKKNIITELGGFPIFRTFCESGLADPHPPQITMRGEDTIGGEGVGAGLADICLGFLELMVL